MKDYLNQKVLITTNNWFYAPDGMKYSAVWGTLKNIHEAKDVFGFTPNRNHANWFVEIGNMIITGCQVNYCVICPTKPDFEKVKHAMYGHGDGAYREFERMNEIYISE